MHVDDSIIFSKVFCEGCLIRGVERLWPVDVGMSCEEQGQVIRFLGSLIVVEKGHVQVFPHNPNMLFALGHSEFQKFARLGPFLGESLSSYHQVRNFLMSQLLMMNHIVLGCADGMYPHVACLVRGARRHWRRRYPSSRGAARRRRAF